MLVFYPLCKYVLKATCEIMKLFDGLILCYVTDVADSLP